MKFIKWFFILMAVLIAAFLVIAVFLPRHVDIQAEISINMSPDKVFHDVASFTNRSFWDPWSSIDSTAETAVDFEQMYNGTRFSWTGNVVGTGNITVDSTDFGKYIRSTVRFGGQQTPAKVTWHFEGNDNKTNVVWTFSSQAKYPLGRYAFLFKKKQIKSRYTNSLKLLKKQLETQGISLSTLSDFSIVNVPSMNTMVATTSGSMATVKSRFDSLFSRVIKAISDQSLQITGPPFSYYFDLDHETQMVTIYCGVPIKYHGEAQGIVRAVSFPSFKAVKAIHTGPYEELPESYQKMMAYIRKNNLKPTLEVWQFYLTDPKIEPIMTSWKTEIYMPIK